ncbi:MAG TPA: ThiF family adenylyltransferase [Pseudolabrys sp.]|nr:ThiF family adenylyltransferase [Pseudolabrys sp.]
MASLEAAAHDEPRAGHTRFSYEHAFERNLGWVTEAEQQRLRRKRVAIAGLGGVGGSHLLTLARLGVGAFSIADFDRFELANLNRQAGATLSSMGLPKSDTLARMARDINPELDLRIFRDGIGPANLDAFLDDVDVYVDSLDFFVLDLRAELYARCRARGIPVICAAPIGMGAAYLVFLPGGMGFEQWFRLAGLTPERQRVNFLLGLAPRGFQRGYVVDLTRVDLARERGPSTAIACELCAGAASAEALKLLLGRGRVHAVPWYHHYDAYRGAFVRRRLIGGNANPLQRLKLAIAYRVSEQLSANAIAPAPEPTSTLDKIIERARWTPSGDNVQPWRFVMRGEDRLVVHVAPSGGVYDYADGRPTLLAAGFLLEALRLAGSEHARRVSWDYLGRVGDEHRIAVTFERSALVRPDPLASFLTSRSVDRRPYRLTPLTDAEKAALAAALGSGLHIEWHETTAARWQVARLNALATEIRLRIPETFGIHRRIVDCARDYSPTGIPMRALGLDPLARRLMRWGFGDWRRMDAMNRLGGTALARLEMDLLPGVFCAAHFTVSHHRPAALPASEVFVLQCGERLHRFWLKATELGLVLQPSLAPLCFADYGRKGAAFTVRGRARAQSCRLAGALDSLAGGAGERILFLGRIGRARSAAAGPRSIRQDRDALLRTPAAEAPSTARA